MHPELTYRMETARVLEAQIRSAETVQECAGTDLAFHRALKFWRQQIIHGLQLSVEELAPIRDEVLPNGGGEIAEFIRALEYGELPAAKATSELGDRRSEIGKICSGGNNGRARENGAGAQTGSGPARASRKRKLPANHANGRESKNGRGKNGAGSIESMRLSTGEESSVKLRARAPAPVKTPLPEDLQDWLEQKSVEVMAQWRE